jgi:hypothetical protein
MFGDGNVWQLTLHVALHVTLGGHVNLHFYYITKLARIGVVVSVCVYMLDDSLYVSLVRLALQNTENLIHAHV